MWQKTDKGLHKIFEFTDFKEAWAFMSKVAEVAERLQHHPRWENEWKTVQIWLSTHEGDELITEKDHELAREIDNLLMKKDES